MKILVLNLCLYLNLIQTILGLNFQLGSGGGVYWALGCDWNNNDMGSAQVSGEKCGGTCLNTNGCTHFTWTNYKGGTCWMKRGSVQPSNALTTRDQSMVCGYRSSNPPGPNPNPNPNPAPTQSGKFSIFFIQIFFTPD